MIYAVFLLSLLGHLGCTKNLKQVHNELRKAQSVSPSHAQDIVAFSAQLSQHVMLLPGSVVRFDNIRANVGGFYFNNSGQFGCPDEGLYVFIWSALKNGSEDLDGMRCILKLMRGASDAKFGPKTNFYTSAHFSGVAQMTAIVQCATTPLTAITVVTVPWDGSQASSLYERYTTFSGFRLTSSIAFTAELLHDQYLFPGSRLMFDNVLSNYGGHYHPLHGLFLCPDNGIYVFTLSVHTLDAETPWSVARLMLEGEVIIQGPITYLTTASHDSGSASTTVVLQCTQGLTVYAEAQAAHDFQFNSYGAELTSFTGFEFFDANVEGAVAFTAVMTSNQTIEVPGQPIVFDRTITNIGDAFHLVLNAFVCPDDDFYMFTWTVVATGLAGGQVNLYMDGTNIKQSHLTPIASGYETTGTSSISHVQQCKQGSILQIAPADGNVVRTFLGDYVFFSGYKIPGGWTK